MNCIEARRMVTPFIKRELSDKEAEQFLKHIEHCSDCRDELDIYFMVYRALDTLDSGRHGAYDFKKMMEEEIRCVKRGILRRKVLRVLRSVTFVVAELLLLLSVFTGFEVKQDETQQSTFHRAIYRLHGGSGARYEAPPQSVTEADSRKTPPSEATTELPEAEEEPSEAAASPEQAETPGN